MAVVSTIKHRKLAGIGVDFCTPKGIERYRVLCKELNEEPRFWRGQGLISREMRAKMLCPKEDGL